MRAIATTLAAVLIVSGHTEGQSRVVLDATPATRVTADQSSSEREVLTPEQREENRIVIEWDGESYRWRTREDRILVYNFALAFHTFVDPRGGGWVKVLDQSEFPEALRFEGQDVQFYESVSSGLTTLTYWGVADSFDP